MYDVRCTCKIIWKHLLTRSMITFGAFIITVINTNSTQTCRRLIERYQFNNFNNTNKKKTLHIIAKYTQCINRVDVLMVFHRQYYFISHAYLKCREYKCYGNNYLFYEFRFYTKEMYFTSILM